MSRADSFSAAPRLAREPYRSCPLVDSRKHIRVLDIAAPDSIYGFEENVHGLLRMVDLDTQPKFSALSYVWGERTSDDTVVNCGSENISVTKNCSLALKSLRNQLGAFSIWVDAICIDQENEAETFHQLPLMHRIYGEAEHVYVWLGMGDSVVKRILSAMHHIGLQQYFDRIHSSSSLRARGIVISKTLACVWKLHWRYFLWEMLFWSYGACIRLGVLTGDLNGHKNRWHTLTKLNIHFEDSGIRLADLQRFFNNSWLGRIWTFQEIMLARSPILVYGLVSVPWESVIISTLYISWTIGEDGVKSMAPWRNLALSRAHLLSSIDRRNSELDKLRNYQKFLHQMACQSLKCCAFTWHVQIICILRCVSVLTFVWLIAGSISLFFIGYKALHQFPLVLSFVIAFCIGGCLIFNIFMLLRRYSLIPREGPRYLEAGRSTIFTESLMLALRHRSVSNRRDYNLGVRAVLQMMDDTTLPVLPPSISIEDSYRDLSLEILTRLSCPYPVLLGPLTNHLDSPSWAVDWAQSVEPLWQDYIHEVCFRRDACATPGSRCDWSNSDSRTESLCTKGRLIGQITALNSLDAEANKKVEAIKALILLFGGSTTEDKELLPYGSSWNELASIIPKGTKLEDARTLLQSQTRLAMRPGSQQTDIYEFWESKLGRQCKALKYTKCVTFSMTHNNNTETAGGIAHLGAAVGDSIVLLAGVPVPVIMRPVFLDIGDDSVETGHMLDDSSRTVQYMKLVSPAGVCGVMRGQMWTSGNDNDLSYIAIV